MDDTKYYRSVQTAVTNFLFCGDYYLFLHRDSNKRVDPGRLNGIGGRVESEENFLDAVIRETKEETGYKVNPKDIRFTGVVRLEGGYKEDWIVAMFKTVVSSKDVPHGMETKDGKLVWIHKDKVLDSDYELVDDLNYCFQEVIKGDSIFFMNGQVGDDERFTKVNISKL